MILHSIGENSHQTYVNEDSSKRS